MKVAVTNIKLKLHAATQAFNLHLFITLMHTQSMTLRPTKNNVVVHAQYHKH